MKKIFLTAFLFFVLQSFAWATTYYIRTDGSDDTNCTGLADAAYDGSGTGEACAYSHPYYAQRVNGSFTTGDFVGGDTMIISPGTYDMGAGHATTGVGSGSECSPSFSGDCRWHIPAGTVGNPTRILGKGYDTETGTKPILRGTGGIYRGVIGFESGQDYMDIEYLDITDNDDCIVGIDNSNITNSCTGSTTYARWGIYMGGTSDTITLKNLNIHGLAHGCVMMSGMSNATIDNVTCRGVGMIGWDSDSPYQTTLDSQSGLNTMTDSIVEYVGCAEALDGSMVANSCVGQGDGINVGYGDAIGFTSDAPGTMADWEITNLVCRYNMSDCFDGLHGDGSGYVKIKRSKFVGNVGASVKGVNPTTIENSIIIDNCSWVLYYDMLDPKFEAGGAQAGNMLLCRADATFSLQLQDDVVHHLIGNTVFGNHDQILSVSAPSGVPTGASVISYNNIYYGGYEWGQDTNVASPFDHPAGDDGKTDSYYFYNNANEGTMLDEDYNIYYNSKDGSGDVNGAHSYYGDPGFTGTIKTGSSSPGYFTDTTEVAQFVIGAGSQARYEVRGANSADEAVTCWGDCTIDFNSFSRGANWDTGYLEYGSEEGGGGSSTQAKGVASGKLIASGTIVF